MSSLLRNRGGFSGIGSMLKAISAIRPRYLNIFFWLMRRDATLSSPLFAAGMLLLTLGLYALSFHLPLYMDTGILGIQRPTQVPLVFLWAGVIAVYWRQRHEHRLSALAEPYALTLRRENQTEAGTVEHHCTSSIGVALFLNRDALQEDVLKWANVAMYQAKEGGLNRIRFHEQASA
ncbi:MAG: diguanylate cyclase [Gallionellaceae bacterium]|nr:MAG: diguanylate cyclase [Gallionellaceae bacterium]